MDELNRDKRAMAELARDFVNRDVRFVAHAPGNSMSVATAR